MPIISKFQINRYKQIPIELTPGNIPDGGFSTFELNSKLGERRGTSDFDGVLIRLVLLGEIEKNSLNTGNISIAQFNQMTQQEVDDRILSGNFFVSKERIGWVEIGSSRPSFYYEDCVSDGKYGKRPKSDNYFDLLEMAPSTYLVNGVGFDIGALQRLNNWNVNETIGNWGTAPYPEQVPMGFNEYLNFAILGQPLPAPIGSTRQIFIPRLFSKILSNVPLLIADYVEHFEGGAYASTDNGKFTLSPSFSNIDSDQPSSEKNVYARLRNTITTGFKPVGIIPREFPELNNANDTVIFENRSTIGNCLLLSNQIITDTSTDSSMPVYFVNDGLFSKDHSHTITTSVDKNILYGVSNTLVDLYAPQAIRSPYTISNTTLNSIQLVSTRYITPDDVMREIDPNTPIEFPPESITFDESIINVKDSIFNSAIRQSMIIIEQNNFRTNDTNKWNPTNSLNIYQDPFEPFSRTFTAYTKPTNQLFQVKKRLENARRIFGISVDDYKQNLIFIREQLKSKRNSII
jgi:hypothetical protein